MVRLITAERLFKKAERFIESQFGTPAGDHLVYLEIGNARDYELGHILKARHATLEELKAAPESRIPSLASEVVVYGESKRDFLPYEAARLLEERGYANVYVLEGGKEAWKNEGYWLHIAQVDADGFVREPAITPLEQRLLRETNAR